MDPDVASKKVLSKAAAENKHELVRSFFGRCQGLLVLFEPTETVIESFPSRLALYQRLLQSVIGMEGLQFQCFFGLDPLVVL